MTSLFKNKNLNALVLSKNLVQYALQMRVLFFSWLAYNNNDINNININKAETNVK